MAASHMDQVSEVRNASIDQTVEQER